MYRKINSYEFEDYPIGVGGMGVVYKANHIYRNEIVAIKALSERLCFDDIFRKDFEKEANILKYLHHENIVRVLDFIKFDIKDDFRMYLVLEYVDGKSLDKYIREERGPIPYIDAITIFLQILEGVKYAHSKGIIHRDIKPGNVLLTNDLKVKIADFGIAKIVADTKVESRTGTKIMGTLKYMSPEQIIGKFLNEKYDIYSLGMTFYEMLAGRLHFEKENTEQNITEQILNEKFIFPDPRTFYDKIPEFLVKIIYEAIEKDKNKRIPSIDVFIKKIKEGMDIFDREEEKVKNKFDEAEEKILNRIGNPSYIRKNYFNYIEASYIKNLPEYSHRYLLLKQKLEIWEKEIETDKKAKKHKILVLSVLILLIFIVFVFFLIDEFSGEKQFNKYMQKGLIEFENNNYSEAIINFQKAKGEKSSKIPDYYIGKSYFHWNKFDDAHNKFKYLEETDSVLYYLGITNYYLKNYDECINNLKKSIQAARSAGVNSKTIIEYEKTLNNLSYSIGDSYFEMGRNYHRQSQYEKAISEFHKALNLYEKPDYYECLGYSHAQMFEYENAVKYLKKAKEIGSTSPHLEYYISLYESYNNIGESNQGELTGNSDYSNEVIAKKKKSKGYYKFFNKHIDNEKKSGPKIILRKKIKN